MLWIAQALAGPAVESETLAQVRHDLYGDRLYPAVTTLRFHEDNAYADLQASLRIDHQAELDLFLLGASSSRSWGRWGLGRQLVSTPLRPQVLDGGSLSGSLGRLELGGWAGMLRRFELDDLSEGQPAARAWAGMAMGSTHFRGGVQADSSVRADVELNHRFELPGQPTAHLLAMGSLQQPTTWLQADFGLRPVPKVQLGLHGLHREALDPQAPLGEALLATFAPEGMDELGASVRLVGARWSALWARGSVSTYEVEGQRQYGHGADLVWLPPRTDRALRLSPAWRYRGGPGGSFHALSGSASLQFGPRRALQARAAVVPYQKLDQPWDTALTAGLSAHQSWRWGQVQLGLEAAHDASYTFDLRGSAGLLLRWP